MDHRSCVHEDATTRDSGGTPPHLRRRSASLAHAVVEAWCVQQQPCRADCDNRHPRRRPSRSDSAPEVPREPFSCGTEVHERVASGGSTPESSTHSRPATPVSTSHNVLGAEKTGGLLRTSVGASACHECRRSKESTTPRECSTPFSSTTSVSARLDDSQERCCRAAYDVSFHGDGRVRERTVHVLLHGASFLLVERGVAGNNTGVYQRSRKVWEHVPLGQLCVFAATGSHVVVTSARSSSSPVEPCAGTRTPRHLMAMPRLDMWSPRDPATQTARHSSCDLDDADAARHWPCSPLTSTAATGYVRVATLNGLRKFGHYADEDGAASAGAAGASRGWCATPSASSITHAIALERVDGEDGQLSGFQHNGVRYWVVGCRERHVLTRLWVPDEDVAPYSQPGTECDEMAGDARAELHGARAVSRMALAQRMALAWRRVLRSEVGGEEAVLRLHDAVCEGQWTLCFGFVAEGWERLVDYWSASATWCAAEDTAVGDKAAHAPVDTLRFFAITLPVHSSQGLCMPVAQALAVFETHHLPCVSHSASVEVNSVEYGALRHAIATRANSAGAVFYGADERGTVERLWKCRCHGYVLERAAQEAIVTHRLQGAALRARLAKKLSTLPREVVREGGVTWERQRRTFLTDFAAWLHRTRRLTPSMHPDAIAELRRRWVSTQRAYCAAGESDNDTNVSCNARHAAARGGDDRSDVSAETAGRARTDVIMLVGPQGCGKSTLARALYALLEQAGYVPRWLNQDEMSNRRAYLAAVQRATSAGGAERATHVILDKMNLSDDMRADYEALQLKMVLTVAWTHAQGMGALSEVCVRRVRERGANHRTFRPTHEAHHPPPSRTPAPLSRQRSSSQGEGRLTMRRMECIVRGCVARYELPCDASLLQVDVTLSRDEVLDRVWQRLRERGLYELPALQELHVYAALDAALRYELLLRRHPHKVTAVALQAVVPEAVLALVPLALRQETRLRGPARDAISVILHGFAHMPCPVALVHYADVVGMRCEVELQGVVADPHAVLLLVRPPCADQTTRYAPCGRTGADAASATFVTHQCGMQRRHAVVDGACDGAPIERADYAVIASARKTSQAHCDSLAARFVRGEASDLYCSMVKFPPGTCAPFVYTFIS